MDALNDRCREFSSDSIVVQESPRESLFKDRYFVCGIGSGIAKDDVKIQLWSYKSRKNYLFVFTLYLLDFLI